MPIKMTLAQMTIDQYATMAGTPIRKARVQGDPIHYVNIIVDPNTPRAETMRYPPDSPVMVAIEPEPAAAWPAWTDSGRWELGPDLD